MSILRLGMLRKNSAALPLTVVRRSNLHSVTILMIQKALNVGANIWRALSSLGFRW